MSNKNNNNNNNKNNNTSTRNVKIKIVGDKNVGKLSYLRTCIDGVPDEYIPHRSDPYFPHQTSLIDINSCPIKLFIDAHQPNRFENYGFQRRGYLILIILFNLCDQVSFNDVLNWYEERKRISNSHYCVLIGNKLDLADPLTYDNDSSSSNNNENNDNNNYNNNHRKGKRVISYQSAMEMAEQLDCVCYVETYKDNPNQKEIFKNIILEVLHADALNKNFYTQFNSDISPNRVFFRQQQLEFQQISQEKERQEKQIYKRTNIPPPQSHSTIINTLPLYMIKTMDISIIRLVLFKNIITSRLIWSFVSIIHSKLKLRVFKLTDVQYLLQYNYFNLLFDILKKSNVIYSIPLSNWINILIYLLRSNPNNTDSHKLILSKLIFNNNQYKDIIYNNSSSIKYNSNNNNNTGSNKNNNNNNNNILVKHGDNKKLSETDQIKEYVEMILNECIILGNNELVEWIIKRTKKNISIQCFRLLVLLNNQSLLKIALNRVIENNSKKLNGYKFTDEEKLILLQLATQYQYTNIIHYLNSISIKPSIKLTISSLVSRWSPKK